MPPSAASYQWRSQGAATNQTYGPAQVIGASVANSDPYTHSRAGGVHDGHDSDLFAGYNPLSVEGTPGRYSLCLKLKKDGSAANDLQVMEWAKTFPVGTPFVTQRSQFVYRSTRGKGVGKASRRPYALIIKPRSGKGNVTGFLRTGLVQVNCGESRVRFFMDMVQEWTTPQSL